VAVTGASSGLGKILVEKAVASGFEVLALSRQRPDKKNLTCHWQSFDMANHSEDWARLFSGCEAVIHLAAQKSAFNEADRARLWAVNVEGTCRMIDAMRRAQVPHMVLAAAANLPAPNSISGFSSLSRSLYLASKLAQEWAALSGCREAGIKCAALRISSIIGDGYSVVDRIARTLLSGNLVNIAHNDCFGADLISAADVAKGLLLAVNQQLQGTFHLSSGRRTSIGTAAYKLCEIAGVPNTLVCIQRSEGEGDEGFPAVDCGPLLQLGYEPRMLTETLQEIIVREREGQAPNK
jgi:nucleoside-diphosphate-sugar epimerase